PAIARGALQMKIVAPFLLLRLIPSLRAVAIVAALVACAHARLDAQTTPTIATVGLTPGWATFGEAVPPGQATSGLPRGALRTQTDDKTRGPDGSIKFGTLTANVPDPGNDHPSTDYPITAATASSGSFTATSQPVSVLLNIGGSAYVATMPTDAGAD